MTACDDFDFELLVFGGLPSHEAALARAHLGGCAACRREHAELVRERDLFAVRRRVMQTEKVARDGLPDIETILATVHRSGPVDSADGLPSASANGFVASLRSRTVWRWATERVAVAAAVAVVGVAIAGRRLYRAAQGRSGIDRGDEPIELRRCSRERTVVPADGSELPERLHAAHELRRERRRPELVPALGRAPRRSLAETAPSPASNDRTACVGSSSSSMPTAFDRVVDGAAMCVPSEI